LLLSLSKRKAKGKRQKEKGKRQKGKWESGARGGPARNEKFKIQNLRSPEEKLAM
jgi:hypothetical protein